MEIEIYNTDLRIYEIDDKCYRVLIDKTRLLGEVWGFIKTDNPNHPRQIEGKLIKAIKMPIATAQ